MISWMTEICCNLIEGAAFGLWNLEVGENEEAQQQDCEYDEDIRATELLQKRQIVMDCEL